MLDEEVPTSEEIQKHDPKNMETELSNAKGDAKNVAEGAEEAIQARAEKLENQLKEKIDEALEEKNQAEKLRRQNTWQVKKIEDLNARVTMLETELQKKTTEIDKILETQGGMGLLLRDMDSITVQTLEQENQIAELKRRNEMLENRLRNKCAQLEEMDATLEEMGLKHEKQIELMNQRAEVCEMELKEKVEILAEKESALIKTKEQLVQKCAKLEELDATLKDTTTKQKELTIITHKRSEMLERQLREKSARLAETESSLKETKGKMEVLLNNLDNVTLRNVEHVEKIKELNESIISLSAAASAFFAPHDLMKRLMSEQAKALSLALADPGTVLDQIVEGKEAMMAEASSIEQVIQSAEPAPIEGVVWQLYAPQEEQKMLLCSSSPKQSGSDDYDSVEEEKDEGEKSLKSISEKEETDVFCGTEGKETGLMIEKEEEMGLACRSEEDKSLFSGIGDTRSLVSISSSCEDMFTLTNHYDQTTDEGIAAENREPSVSYGADDDYMSMHDDEGYIGKQENEPNEKEEKGSAAESGFDTPTVCKDGDKVKDALKLSSYDERKMRQAPLISQGDRNTKTHSDLPVTDE